MSEKKKAVVVSKAADGNNQKNRIQITSPARKS